MLNRPRAEPFTQANNHRHVLSPGELVSFFREAASQIEDNVVGVNKIFDKGVFVIISLIVLLNVKGTITLFVFIPLAVISVVIHRIA